MAWAHEYRTTVTAHNKLILSDNSSDCIQLVKRLHFTDTRKLRTIIMHYTENKSLLQPMSFSVICYGTIPVKRSKLHKIPEKCCPITSNKVFTSEHHFNFVVLFLHLFTYLFGFQLFIKYIYFFSFLVCIF